ncbi:hypothetical protein A9179_21305 [Pseudomonas alcaligenes]|uniref:Acyl carrier protein n=1 Tax=Aquipseudomonas alcaligenes TaxID=43263 RepID=A0ABR7S7J1_AQUAC|nr:hypothetical protein [Pseudomonas alcaligenes]MBC9252810.1 hypothetical protein [Pseudomonas alcaligenes]
MPTLKQQIEDVLGNFWDEREISITSDPATVDELGAPLDSLTACEAMIEIDALVQRKVPVDVVIRNGGYESKEQFIQQITEGVLKYLGENNG